MAKSPYDPDPPRESPPGSPTPFQAAGGFILIAIGSVIALWIVFFATGMIRSEEPPAIVRAVTHGLSVRPPAAADSSAASPDATQLETTIATSVGYVATFLLLCVVAAVAGRFIVSGVSLVRPNELKQLQELLARRDRTGTGSS